MGATQPFWTPDRRAEALRLRAEGDTATVISLRLGCSQRTVLRLFEIEFPKPKPVREPKEFLWTEKRVALLKKLRAEGHSFGEIAQRLGVSRNAALGKATRLGLTGPVTKSGAPKSPWTVERTATLKRLHAEGRSPKDIGAVLGLSIGQVHGKIRTLNLPLRNVVNETQNVAARLKRAEMTIAFPAPFRSSRENCAPPPPEGKTLLDLNPHECRFPLGGRNDRAVKFCGCKTEEGRSYCPEHHAIAYVPRHVRRSLKVAA